MKRLTILFLVLLVLNVFSQEPYDYLEVVVENGDSWVNIKNKPVVSDTTNFFANKPIKTVSLQEFLETEPSITQPEGFYLASELEDWRRASSILYQVHLPKDISEKYIAELAASLSHPLFGDSLANLERDKFIRLWISLSRAVISAKNRYQLPHDSNFKHQSKEAALTAELVWRLMTKSWTVADVKVFSLHNPNDFSINLLIDAGANIMTKVVILPEVYYHKPSFNYDLVNKSSKDLKHFGVAQKHKKH